MISKIKQIYINNSKVIYELVINDFRTRYNGSVLGMIWGLIQPIVTIMIYWLVFQYGLKSGARPDGVPYVIYMISGAVPWFFFSEAWGGITTCFLDYSYLVKKLNFDIRLLPIVKLGAAMVIHIVFMAITTVVLNFAGYYASWYYIQVIYYLFAVSVFTILLGLITSSLSVYIRDVIQIVGIIIQIGFWANPICWGDEILSGVLGYILKVNPMYYCVEGYRNSLLYRKAFWEEPLYTVYFWAFNIVLFFLARYIFNKMKANFADVI